MRFCVNRSPYFHQHWILNLCIIVNIVWYYEMNHFCILELMLRVFQIFNFSDNPHLSLVQGALTQTFCTNIMRRSNCSDHPPPPPALPWNITFWGVARSSCHYFFTSPCPNQSIQLLIFPVIRPLLLHSLFFWSRGSTGDGVRPIWPAHYCREENKEIRTKQNFPTCY